MGDAPAASRAHHNMLESLVLFAALLGAQIFFWARLAYAVAYIAGIPWVRTGVWFVSVIGLAIIFLQGL